MKNFMGKGLTGAEMRRLKGQLNRTRWAMRAERVAQACWPLFVVVCLLIAAALLGWFDAFGPVVHRVLLGVAGLAIAGALVLGGLWYRHPTDAEIEDRLDEADRRRPLATLRDQLVVGKGTRDTETVWAAYRQRARSAAAALMARAPDLRLASRDRWALRLFAPVLLIGGLIATGGNISDPIAAVTDPAPVAGETATLAERAPSAEAWAIPPAYTGLPTIYLEKQAADAAPIKVPTGSQITIRVTDYDGTPGIDGGALAGIEGFSLLGGGLAEANGELTRSGEIAIKTGEDRLAAWKIEIIPDEIPEISLTEPPGATVTRALNLTYEATDDYGVTAAWAEIAPEGYDPEKPKGLPLEVIALGLPLPLMGDNKTAAETSINDFTAHPWAGAEVVVRLFAEDGAGQQGKADPITFTLPERIFNHPLARALVEQRRELAMDFGQSERVLDVLQAITRRPHEVFGKRHGPYLTTKIAIRRLAIAVGTETIPDAAPEIVELLWQAALGLENGNLSSALERLRQAQENLRKALESGTDEEVRRAMDELRQAMNEYLQQLARQQRERGPQDGQRRPNEQMLSQQDLQRMLDEMQRQAESGARDQARQMLSELSRMMENLRARQGDPQQGPGQQAMKDLQDLIRRQRDLADETFDQMRQRRREEGRQEGQQGQQGQRPGDEPGFGDGQGRGNQHGQRGEGGEPGEEGRPGERGSNSGRPGAGGGLAQEQEALRRRLEALSRGIGSDEAARALEEAVRSMGEARDDLQGGNNGEAVRDQMRALDELNKGADALAQEIQNGQGDTAARGNRRGEGQSRDSETEDPFDRPTATFGTMDGRATKVPDKALVDRARELMEELRRRSGEPERPQLELDYLDRLMERF